MINNFSQHNSQHNAQHNSQHDGFTLSLRSPSVIDTLEGVRSFIGEDASGSFGILPYHRCMITILSFGLARYKNQEQQWKYIAMPGAVLRFNNNQLTLDTQRYLLCDSYEDITASLQEVLIKEHSELKVLKNSVKQIEDTIIRRLSELDSLSVSLGQTR